MSGLAKLCRDIVGVEKWDGRDRDYLEHDGIIYLGCLECLRSWYVSVRS
jgi:hypothetical protein